MSRNLNQAHRGWQLLREVVFSGLGSLVTHKPEISRIVTSPSTT